MIICYTGWWFQIFLIFTPIWGRFPFWLIFFKGVTTTNQYSIYCIILSISTYVIIFWNMVKYVNRCMYCIFIYTYVWRNAYSFNICTCLFHACMQLITAHVRFYACTLFHVYTCTYKCLPTFWTDKQVDRQTDRQSVSLSVRQTQRDTDRQAVDNVHVLCRILNMYTSTYVFCLCLCSYSYLRVYGTRISYTWYSQMMTWPHESPRSAQGIRCRVFFVHLTHKFLFLKMPGLWTFNCMNISTI